MYHDEKYNRMSDGDVLLLKKSRRFPFFVIVGMFWLLSFGPPSRLARNEGFVLGPQRNPGGIFEPALPNNLEGL